MAINHDYSTDILPVSVIVDLHHLPQQMHGAAEGVFLTLHIPGINGEGIDAVSILAQKNTDMMARRYNSL